LRPGNVEKELWWKICLDWETGLVNSLREDGPYSAGSRKSWLILGREAARSDLSFN
jgi:hypothetical protein